MQRIQIKDRWFTPSVPEQEILSQVKRVAEEINRDYQGEQPLFLAVLNGSFMFASDLMKEISLPCEISFVKMASYSGTASTGTIHELIGLKDDIAGRHVVIIEDIVDTGITMSHMLELLRQKNPKSIQICTLLLKPDKLQIPLEVKYCGLKIPNEFIVGYGLDYAEQGRNLRDIYTVVEE